MHARATIKVGVSLLASAAFLIFGGIAADLLWYRVHHRYDQPNTGAYYGHVYATLEDRDYSAWLHFEGTTKQRWYLFFPENFRYSELDLKWRRWSNFGIGDSTWVEGQASLSLPSFTYTSSNTTGKLDREVLAGWLLGTTNRTQIGTNSIPIGAIYDYLEAAAEGSLPPPRHHTYYFGLEGGEKPDGPLFVTLQHFRLGLGVGDYVWAWILAWICFTWLFWRRWFRRGGTEGKKPVRG